MDKKPTVPINCFFQGCYNPAYEEQISKCKKKCFRYNRLCPNDRKAQLKILKKLLGKMGRNTVITPPFWCDYGYNISVGDYFYSNHGMIITDGAKVTFGDHVFIAPNCCFTTAEHAIDPEMRKAGIEIAKPITVGNNVWIGAGSTILAGVEIGIIPLSAREALLQNQYRKMWLQRAFRAEFYAKLQKKTKRGIRFISRTDCIV